MLLYPSMFDLPRGRVAPPEPSEEPVARAVLEEPPLLVLFPSPVGDLGLTLHGNIVTSVRIAPKRKEKRRYKPFEEIDDSEFLDEVFGRLSEYFAGARPSPDLEWDLGTSDLTPFARRVLKETAKIPYGKHRTYRKIAAAAGKPDAYRLVLATLAGNPIPILIPCHRVVTNKSGIGSYIGGRERKRWLLTMEKEAVKAGVS